MTEDSKKDGENRHPRRVVKDDDSYTRCAKHGIKYPQGAQCPQCAAEARRKQ